jgi:hypothetical protein
MRRSARSTTEDRRFTPEAQKFAWKTKIELIDGKALEELIGSVSVARPTPDGTRKTPACPQCGAEMIERTAKRGGLGKSNRQVIESTTRIDIELGNYRQKLPYVIAGKTKGPLQ